MTEITLEARQHAIAAAQQAAAEAVKNGTGAAQKFEYKGETLPSPVVRIELDYVLLNPHSHRIGAQVQSRSADERALLETDPYGSEAQKLISQLLRETEGYEGLKNILARDKQRDPGVMTISGILINANTRAVALRELGEKYLDVVVLPADAGKTEFNELELRLQMAREGKQAYSFTSQLLFIEDLINSGRSTTEIGVVLYPDLADDTSGQKEAASKVEQEVRLLALVRDVVSLGAGKTTFQDLDNSRQAFIEIDSDFQSMKNKNREVADLVKDAQLTAMISGLDYRKIRAIDHNLIANYVLPAMEEETSFAGRTDALLAVASATDSDDSLTGLDLLEDDDPDDTEVSFRGLLALVASTDKEASVELPGTESTPPATVSAKVLRNSIFEAFHLAIKAKVIDDQSGDTLTAPTRQLAAAAKNIDNALLAYEQVRNDAKFDDDAFEAAHQKLQRAYDALTDVLEEQLSTVPGPA